MRVTCSICGDLFLPSQDVVATPCGHTFHHQCILSWLERKSSCPQCRDKATQKKLIRLFFDTRNPDGDVDPDALTHQIDNLKFQVTLKEQEIKKLTEEARDYKTQADSLRKMFRESESTIRDKDTSILTLRKQLSNVDELAAEAERGKQEVKKMKEKMRLLEGVEKVLNGTTEEVTLMVNSYNMNVKALASFCTVLKKELKTALNSQKTLQSETTSARRKHEEVVKLTKILKEEVEAVTSNLNYMQRENKVLHKNNKTLKEKIVAMQHAITSPSDDVRSSALHRLLSESPAPGVLKRLHTKDDSISTTPQVKKLNSSTTREVLQEKAGTSSGKTEEAKENSNTSKRLDFLMPSTPCGSSSRLLSNKFDILGGKHLSCNKFAKEPKSDTSIESWNWKIQGYGAGYDGLGSHHKPDVFPKSLGPGTPKNNFNSAKKQVRRKTVKAKCKPVTLGSYFKNTFDD